MNPKQGASSAWCGTWMVCLTALLLLGPTRVEGGVKVVDQEDFSLELGLRMQPRLVYVPIPTPGGGSEWERTFLVRRTRFKMNGRMLSAKYGFEWRLDGTGLSSGVVQSTPIAGVENAWIQWPLSGAELQVRAGLYDQPFSRDRLTSDSGQLAVDRGAVSNVPNAFGLVDNAIGFDVRGELHGGRYAYAVGLFDNRTIAAQFQDIPMVVGRVDFNLGSTKDIYRDAHFGGDSWYSLGLNGSYHTSIEDTTGADDGARATAGVDGMLDVPAGPGRLFVRAEANLVKVDAPRAVHSKDTTVWMAGLGYLFLGQRLQPIVRFDQVRLDETQGSGITNITHVGMNFYQKGHSLKLQADVRFQSATGESVDEGRLQAQVDF